MRREGDNRQSDRSTRQDLTEHIGSTSAFIGSTIVGAVTVFENLSTNAQLIGIGATVILYGAGQVLKYRENQK